MRVRELAALVAVAACHRDPAPPAPAPAPAAAPRAPGDAAPRDAAPPPPVSIRDNFARIAAGNLPERVCFALSANHHRAACDLGHWTNQMGVSLALAIVGDRGDLVSDWPYAIVDGAGHGDRDVARDRKALDEARAALEGRHYQPAAQPEHVLGDGDVATVGDWIVRRSRPFVEHEGCPPWDPAHADAEPCPGGWDTHAEKLEVQCNGSWRALPLTGDDFLDVRYDTPRVVMSALTDRLVLIVVDAVWGIEGEHGGSRAATVVDVAAVCG